MPPKLFLHGTVNVFVAIAMLFSSATAAEIRFRPQARAQGSVVRLGDIADIATADKREREALETMELGPADSARQVLPARDVQDRLAVQGVKLASHQFSGAAVVTVAPHIQYRAKTDHRPLSKSAINQARRAVADAIITHLKNAADPDEHWTVEVELNAEQARDVAAGHRRVTALGGRAPWTGQQRFVVTMPDDGRTTSFTLLAEVKRAPRIVVAINNIARGEPIRAADVELQSVKPGSAQQGAFQSLDEVLGQEASRNIIAGQAIDSQYVRSPVLVKRGDVVELYARSAGVQIRTKARAREQGSHGDLVQIELLSDRKVLLARVCGVQEVEILAAGPTVEQ